MLAADCGKVKKQNSPRICVIGKLLHIRYSFLALVPIRLRLVLLKLQLRKAWLY